MKNNLINLFSEMVTPERFYQIFDETTDLVSKLELILAYQESNNDNDPILLQNLLPQIIDTIYHLQTKNDKYQELVETLWIVIKKKDEQIHQHEPEWNTPSDQDDATLLGLRNKQ